MLADTLSAVRALAGVSRILAYDPSSAGVYFKELAPDFWCIPQTGDGLGGRMQEAVSAVFSEGVGRIVLIGSDLPHLAPRTLAAGFAGLRQGSEVVLGPSADGGYYLIGLHEPQPLLFDVPMGTPLVLEQTLARARQLGLTCHLLPEDFDIDTGKDLERLEALLDSDPAVPAERTRAWLAQQTHS